MMFHRTHIAINLRRSMTLLDLSPSNESNILYSPDWPKYSSSAADIWKYLDKVCEIFDLRKEMTFNTEVIGCYWNEEAGEWTVKLRQSDGVSAPRVFEEKCDLLIQGTGILNNFQLPDIEGLDKFKGRVLRE